MNESHQQIEVTLRLHLWVPARLSVEDIKNQVAVNIVAALPTWTAEIAGPPVEILTVREEADIYSIR